MRDLIASRNLGVLVCDAGCDPKGHFADLGNAIRKCAIDLRTEIKFLDVESDERSLMIGKIVYPHFDGVLLYIKPHMTKDVPIDVDAYAKSHDKFPHETTTDQWYSESQFESYRHLGLHIVESLGLPPLAPEQGLDAMFAALNIPGSTPAQKDSATR